MPGSHQTRKFTISFPEDLARQVDLLAEEESRNTSELFREAFRAYRKEKTASGRTLQDSISQITPQNRHSETLVGRPAPNVPRKVKK